MKRLFALVLLLLLTGSSCIVVSPGRKRGHHKKACKAQCKGLKGKARADCNRRCR